jgi:hypothetical protein
MAHYSKPALILTTPATADYKKTEPQSLQQDLPTPMLLGHYQNENAAKNSYYTAPTAPLLQTNLAQTYFTTPSPLVPIEESLQSSVLTHISSKDSILKKDSSQSVASSFYVAPESPILQYDPLLSFEQPADTTYKTRMPKLDSMMMPPEIPDLQENFLQAHKAYNYEASKSPVYFQDTTTTLNNDPSGNSVSYFSASDVSFPQQSISNPVPMPYFTAQETVKLQHDYLRPGLTKESSILRPETFPAGYNSDLEPHELKSEPLLPPPLAITMVPVWNRLPYDQPDMQDQDCTKSPKADKNSFNYIPALTYYAVQELSGTEFVRPTSFSKDILNPNSVPTIADQNFNNTTIPTGMAL